MNTSDLKPESFAEAAKQAKSEGCSGSRSAPCYADCDCEDQIPSDEYICDGCGVRVVICADCYTIISSCGCGHCDEGATFHESD